jgi:hypothetical protein
LLDTVLAGGAHIPFPFSALTAELERYAGPTMYGAATVKQILVPLGRSLQRHANAPDYFNSPRIVVAVDTESGRDANLPNLQDRLYLGYQPEAGVIEAISWNPRAGQFEFQVIRDYRKGGTPKLLYAERQVCTSCHQNTGPMFARAPWTETNANPRVADRLQRVLTAFHGVSLYGLAATVEHVDAATNRASDALVMQRLWSTGCGIGDAGNACRAALFIAMLQYRLTDGAHFDNQSGVYRRRLVAQMSRTWAELWPSGLLIPDADLVDHDPLIERHTGTVPAHVDPLTRRRPATRWDQPDGEVMRRAVTALADRLDTHVIAQLDQHLASTSGHRAGAIVRLRCRSRVWPRTGGAERVRSSCGVPGDLARAELEIMRRGSLITEGQFLRLDLGARSYNPVSILGGRVRGTTFGGLGAERRGSSARTRVDLIVFQRTSLLSLRLPDDNSVRAARLYVGTPKQGTQLELHTTSDFSGVVHAVDRLLVSNNSVFGHGPPWIRQDYSQHCLRNWALSSLTAHPRSMRGHHPGLMSIPQTHYPVPLRHSKQISTCR